MEIAIAKSELEELTDWNGIAIHLCESVLVQGRPVTTPVTPVHNAPHAPPPPPATAATRSADAISRPPLP
jgi:hypothetical protein